MSELKENDLKERLTAILENECPNRPWEKGGRTDQMILRCISTAYNLDRDNDGWISVDGYENVPNGTWQVYLEKPYVDSRISVICVENNFATIGGHFAFDLHKVTHYRPLPNPPQS